LVRVRRWALVISSVWLCTGCAGPASDLPQLPAAEVAAEQHRQQIAQMRDYYAQVARVDNVAFHIRVANREYCQNVSAQIGLHAITVRSLPGKYRSYSSEALDVSWTRATVISVADDSPAMIAGIKTGDQILTLNNEPVPPTRTAGWLGGWLKHNGEAPVQTMVRRNGVDTLRTVNPVIACAIPVVVEVNPEAGAFSTQDKIVVQTGVLRLTRNDADLAMIVGHEFAHVNMAHYQKKLQNLVLGAAAGIVVDGGFMLGSIDTRGAFMKHFASAGASAFSVNFEREADYVGAYYAARAGYDISGTENVWREMALEDPGAIRLVTTHPTLPARFVQMKKVIAEIADKKRHHRPLVPELKVIQLNDRHSVARGKSY
jgi:Zn-dependent protease with chaperone function